MSDTIVESWWYDEFARLSDRELEEIVLSQLREKVERQMTALIAPPPEPVPPKRMGPYDGIVNVCVTS